MHIVVCAKRVPSTTANIRPAADGKSVDPTGVEFILSPYDEMALERAVQLKEAGAATKVTVLTLGPSNATKDIRKALAIGADAAVLVTDDGSFRDPAAVAGVLAEVITELGADAVFTGWKAIDDDSSAVGALLAERLGFAYASFAVSIEAEDGALVVHREVEGATQVLRVPTPCVVTAQKGLAEARFASLKGIMKAKRKPLDERPVGGAESASSLVALAPPPARPEGRIVGEGAGAVPALVDALRNEVHVL